jgi:tetratricopeptide (TPR) repeat protein
MAPWVLGVLAALITSLASGFAVGASATAPSSVLSVDNTSLPPVARIAAGQKELLALQQLTSPDRKRMADVAKELGDLLGDLDDEQRAEHHAEAIRDYRLALRYYTKRSAPREWAELNNDLAVEYLATPLGESGQNIEQALAAHEAALTVYTRKQEPRLWALVESDLCVVLRKRKVGSRSANVEAAIAACKLALTVRTRATAPSEFAATSENLALALSNRTVGTERGNLDAQIAAYEDAISALPGQADHVRAARMKWKVGVLYARRADRFGAGGDRDQAIARITAALSPSENGLEDEERADAEQEIGGLQHGLTIRRTQLSS